MRNSVDLFTGIGGFCLALADVYKPVVYCDNSPDVQKMLGSLIKSGKLPKGKIVHDVRDIATILDATKGKRIHMITAGFPCTGFSKSGSMEGLKNDASSLFFDTVKVIKAVKPDTVLFENVAEITKTKDLDTILKVMTGSGYDCRWTVCSGLDVHAPQIRRRWFCLCAKRGTQLPNVAIRKVVPRWKLETMPAAVVDGRPEDFIPRFSALGNSIIPQVARLAFARLYSGFQILTVLDLEKTSELKYGRDLLHTPTESNPNNGFIVSGNTAVYVTVPLVTTRPFEFELDPTHFTTVRESEAKTRSLSNKVIRSVFPTPRATNWRHSAALTPRTTRDIASFVLFLSKVNGRKQQKRDDRHRINIHLVEWLMGFPRDWTRA